MKQGTFITVLLVVAFVASIIIFNFLPDFIRAGGPLVVGLITLSIMAVAFIFERTFSLRKARGAQSIPHFLAGVKR